jgi:hypothetical protein
MWSPGRTGPRTRTGTLPAYATVSPGLDPAAFSRLLPSIIAFRDTTPSTLVSAVPFRLSLPLWQREVRSAASEAQHIG